MICRVAARGGCNEPNELETVYIDCPNCRDGSCGLCNDGTLVLIECPCKTIPEYVFRMIEMADLAEDKLFLPVGGGLLDQTQAFVDSLRFVNAQKQWCKNQLGRE